MKIYSVFLVIFFALTVQAQTFERELSLPANVSTEITNLYGRVDITAVETDKAFLTVTNASESDIKIISLNNRLQITVNPGSTKLRFDLSIKLPLRSRVRVVTGAGEVRVAGNLESASVETDTGTIAAQVPLDDLRYEFIWTASRPRFLSDAKLEEVKEKSAGRFGIKGIINQKEKERDIADEEESGDEEPKNEKDKKPKPNERREIKLNLTTARGVILLNVNPGEVPSDLRERPLTEAAKAIIRSGDSLLMEAIRRASPKYFGEYAATLPPFKKTPVLTLATKNEEIRAQIKQVLVSVTDVNNRAVADLKKEDFDVTESGREREILSVTETTAPFNLVLLLDVSGSVDNYVDFIRKAARNFVNTVSPQDRIAIIIFNEDVKELSTFTTDKGKLSESLDTFDAGGSTAYYDALAYTLTQILRPLRGERTGIVALSDGDDNRSFLSFDSLLGSIQESGALVYPLYVPSTLIAASATNNSETTIDPLRTRYMGLTSKAEAEGEKLARISGGVFYSIRQLSQLQKAYDDIVVQLRTAYTVTFRSDVTETRTDGTTSPRLRIKIKRPNTFVKLGSVVEVPVKETSKIWEKDFHAKAQSEKENSETHSEISFSNARQNSLFSFASFAPLQENLLQKTALPDFSANNQTGEISGEIVNVKYQQFVNDKLKTSNFEGFDVNKSQGAFLISNGSEEIAVSRWISPKRTRSYPYERVYDTLAFGGKKVTIIPVVKDEGLGGERDFLQWDTISLLSLLDVHVVLAYYDKAEKNAKRADQITAQKFDNNYISARLNEIFNFKGTTRQWNERETKQLKTIFEKAKLAYREISKQTKTYLHDETTLDEIIKYAETPQKFIEFSRQKSKDAQSREFVTDQPKEALSTDTKSKVTITNALFGKYFFTVDETRVEPQTVYLIEAKHSQRSKMPSRNDIKDGLIKMMVYTNLQKVKVGAKNVEHKVQIRLTSNQLKGSITSDIKDEDLEKFCIENSIDAANVNFLKKLFEEARTNKFTIILEHAETA